MKYVIFIIIFILIFVLFISLVIPSSKTDYVVPFIQIKNSEKIGSRGVFATKDYKKDDIIEICPTISDKTPIFQGIVKDYIFKYDETDSILAFGFCSMYNHSDNYNALWTVLSKDQMKFYATKDIKKGEEIFTSYGDAYWKTRNELKK
jgi:hypothetical protein